MQDIKILVIEGEARTVSDIQETLNNLEFEYTEIVPSGRKAVESVQRSSPDLIISDIEIEGDMDGIQTIESIRKTNCRIPIIYLADHRDSGTVERAKKTQPVNYILKPFQQAELAIAIELAINNKR